MTILSITITLFTYVFLTSPTGHLIGLLTKRWRKELKDQTDSLKEAGKVIGYLERFLILTFIIFGQFSAIGFLLAAKSILRVGDKESRKETEYILIGTLASFSAAIIAGIILLGTLQYFEIQLIDLWNK